MERERDRERERCEGRARRHVREGEEGSEGGGGE